MAIVTVAFLLIGLCAVTVWRTNATVPPPHPLADATARTLEFVGLWTICLILNATCGIVLILSVRTFTRAFVSIYVLDDISLVLVSAVQAFIVYARLASRACADTDL